MFAGGKIVDLLAVELVTDADLNLVESVEDIQLRQREAVDAAGPHRLAHQHCVEPPAAPRPSGHDAEFLAALAKRLADLVELFGGERSRADACGVSFADAENIADRVGAQTGAGRRLRGNGV